jgi:hypothetical protein
LPVHTYSGGLVFRTCSVWAVLALDRVRQRVGWSPLYHRDGSRRGEGSRRAGRGTVYRFNFRPVQRFGVHRLRADTHCGEVGRARPGRPAYGSLCQGIVCISYLVWSAFQASVDGYMVLVQLWTSWRGVQVGALVGTSWCLVFVCGSLGYRGSLSGEIVAGLWFIVDSLSRCDILLC